MRAAQRITSVTKQLTRTMSTPSGEGPRFSRSPATPDALGPGRHAKTAAIAIIGDEVLNGKTKDSNSNFAAKLFFDLGIDLKRIEVIADDEDEIVECARRMTDKYDIVLTSGGIGPTHDDITYSSLAKAFDNDGKLKHDDETIHRMESMARHSKRYNWDEQTEEQKTARLRMALFPTEHSEILFVAEQLWVPVVRLRNPKSGGLLAIFPGIPRLFTELYVPLPPSKPYRHLIRTDMPESNIAPYLTKLAERTKDEGIRVGSYPDFRSGVSVSLIGRDLERLKVLGDEVCKELDGKVVATGKLGEEEKK